MRCLHRLPRCRLALHRRHMPATRLPRLPGACPPAPAPAPPCLCAPHTPACAPATPAPSVHCTHHILTLHCAWDLPACLHSCLPLALLLCAPPSLPPALILHHLTTSVPPATCHLPAGKRRSATHHLPRLPAASPLPPAWDLPPAPACHACLPACTWCLLPPPHHCLPPACLPCTYCLLPAPLLHWGILPLFLRRRRASPPCLRTRRLPAGLLGSGGVPPPAAHNACAPGLTITTCQVPCRHMLLPLPACRPARHYRCYLPACHYANTMPATPALPAVDSLPSVTYLHHCLPGLSLNSILSLSSGERRRKVRRGGSEKVTSCTCLMWQGQSVGPPPPAACLPGTAHCTCLPPALPAAACLLHLHLPPALHLPACHLVSAAALPCLLLLLPPACLPAAAPLLHFLLPPHIPANLSGERDI